MFKRFIYLFLIFSLFINGVSIAKVDNDYERFNKDMMKQQERKQKEWRQEQGLEMDEVDRTFAVIGIIAAFGIITGRIVCEGVRIIIFSKNKNMCSSPKSDEEGHMKNQ